MEVASSTTRTKKLKHILRSTPYFKAGKLQLIAVSFCINLLSLALPLMLLQVYDRVLAQSGYSTLLMLALGVTCAIILEATLKLARSYTTGWSAACFEHHASSEALTHVMHSDITAYNAQPTSVHMQRLSALSSMRDFFAGQALISMVDVPFVLLFLAGIYYLAGPLVLVPVILLGLFVLLASYTGMRLKAHLQQRKTADSAKYSLLLKLFGSMHTIKSMALEPFMMRRFENKQTDVTHANYKAALSAQAANNLGHAMSQIALVSTVAFGAVMVMRAELSVGGLAACTLLAGRVMQPVARLLGLWTRFQHYRVAKQEVNALFALPRASNENAAPIAKRNIRIQGLRFGYDEAAMPLFHKANAVIPHGSITALLGQKGSGKTTLLKLVLGVLHPQAGHCSIGSNAIHPSHWGKQVAYIPQHGDIFRGSVMDNLTSFHRREAIESSAREIATLLGIDQFVAGLPQGYDTMLSDSDADPMPPGMKQRIAIARAFVQKPSMVLFDDADKALDKEGYNLLFRLLGTRAKGSTIVMATQDQNLLALATHFIEINENGTLDTLEGSAAHNIRQFVQRVQQKGQL